MALVRWSPFREFERFFEDEDLDLVPFFPTRSLRVPACDVYETDKDVVAEIEVPNIDPKDVDILIEDDVLRVSGETKKEKEKKEKNYYRKETRKGTFSRQIVLPESVKADKAKATYEDGVLKITMPKEKPKKKKKVKVSVD